MYQVQDVKIDDWDCDVGLVDHSSQSWLRIKTLPKWTRRNFDQDDFSTNTPTPQLTTASDRVDRGLQRHTVRMGSLLIRKPVKKTSRSGDVGLKTRF